MIEGAAALGFEDGDTPRLACDREATVSGGVTTDHAVAIRGWDTFRRARLPRAFGDDGTGNIAHGRNVIPYLGGELGSGDIAISTVFLGTAEQATELDLASRLQDQPSVRWDAQDTAHVSWRGLSLAIAWPAEHRD